jgi:hypothetical protein
MLMTPLTCSVAMAGRLEELKKALIQCIAANEEAPELEKVPHIWLWLSCER